MRKPRKVAIERAKRKKTTTLASANRAIKKGTKGEVTRHCKRCDDLVAKSNVEGYTYQCFTCDEDLYSMETYTKTVPSVPREPLKKETAVAALDQEQKLMTDYDMQNWLEAKGHKLYDPAIDNDTDIEQLHQLAVSYEFQFDADTYLWSR